PWTRHLKHVHRPRRVVGNSEKALENYRSPRRFATTASRWEVCRCPARSSPLIAGLRDLDPSHQFHDEVESAGVGPVRVEKMLCIRSYTFLAPRPLGSRVSLRSEGCHSHSGFKS